MIYDALVLIAGIITSVVVLAIFMFPFLWEVHVNKKEKTIRKSFLKKIPADNSWEKEWLDTLREQHYVRKIEPAKLVFKFAKEPMENRKQLDGFKVYCSCGQGEIIGLDLKMVKRNYAKHLEKEGERALAAIGRFEMPKGIDWKLEAEKE